MTTEEIWKPVVGYEGLYEVSDAGSVRFLGVEGVDSLGRPYTRNPTPRMTAGVNSEGYPEVNLKKTGARRTVRVHTLVLEAFVGHRPDGCVTRHLNGVRDDNRLENLKWGTQSENMLDKRRHGTDHNVNKSECPAGHDYDEENTLTYSGRRSCRTCSREAVYARRKALKGTEPPQHGTYYSYSAYACRCELCKDAKRVQRGKENS